MLLCIRGMPSYSSFSTMGVFAKSRLQRAGFVGFISQAVPNGCVPKADFPDVQPD